MDETYIIITEWAGTHYVYGTFLAYEDADEWAQMNLGGRHIIEITRLINTNEKA